MKSQTVGYVVVASALGFLLACDSSGSHGRPPNPDEIPPSVAVTGGHLSSGVAIGEVRKDVTVDAFRIAKNPVTITYYKECISAGACTTPNLNAAQCKPSPLAAGLHQSTLGLPGADQLPVTCVTPDQARTYCKWVGATLPTPEQFELAARGELVHRYAWGDKGATCAQRADALGADPITACCAATSSCSDINLFAVGKHSVGVSGFAVEDILLTQAELLSSSATSQFAVCSDANHSCAATGMGGGGIDGFVAFEAPTDTDVSATLPDVGFRCTWSGS